MGNKPSTQGRFFAVLSTSFVFLIPKKKSFHGGGAEGNICLSPEGPA